MRQDVYYDFPSPPDPALGIIRRELAVRVNGQPNPAIPFRVKPDVKSVLIGTFSAAGGENIEVDHYDVDGSRRKTPVAAVRFTVPSPPALTAPAEGTFRVDQVLEAGEEAEEAEEEQDDTEVPENPASELPEAETAGRPGVSQRTARAPQRPSGESVRPEAEKSP